MSPKAEPAPPGVVQDGGGLPGVLLGRCGHPLVLGGGKRRSGCGGTGQRVCPGAAPAVTSESPAVPSQPRVRPRAAPGTAGVGAPARQGAAGPRNGGARGRGRRAGGECDRAGVTVRGT